MTLQELNELESLLALIRGELGCRFCIIPDYLNEGYCLITYNSDNNIEYQLIGATIQDCIDEFKAIKSYDTKGKS